MRIGDPALMLLKPDAHFDRERLVRADILRALLDPPTDWDAPNGRLWIRRGLLLLGIAAIVVCLSRRRRN
jgi:hypothetical protein